MKFQVSRTSNYSSDSPSCEDTVKEEIVEVDVRRVRNSQSLPLYWFDKGRNHRQRESDGAFIREMPTEAYTIEIESLEALMAFIQKYEGRVVIHAAEMPEPPRLEIYDDYRE